MEKPYIAIYKEALDKGEFAALRAQVARGAFTRLTGGRSEYILDVYKFTFKTGGPGYAAYVIRGEPSRMLIQLARPPELMIDGRRESIKSLNKLELALSTFETFRNCINEAEFQFEDHGAFMEKEVGFAYPFYCQLLLKQLTDALPHADAHLRSHLLEQFDRLGVDH
jgi:hypothetical protein